MIVASEIENGEISKNLKYMCHTTKNLDLIRIFLKNIKDKNTKEGIKFREPLSIFTKYKTTVTPKINTLIIYFSTKFSF